MENTQQIVSAIQNEDDSDFDFKKLLYSFLHYWPWFVAAIFTCLLIAFLYLRYATPVYNISCKILIKDDKSGSSASSQDLLSQLDVFNTKNNVNNEKQVLQTRFLVNKVVNALQLNVRYFSVGSIKSTELYKDCPFQIRLVSIKDSIPTQTFDLETSGNNREFIIHTKEKDHKYRLYDTIKNQNVSFVMQPVAGAKWSNDNYRIAISTTDATTDKYLQALTFNIIDKLASVIAVTLPETVPGKGEDILNKLYEVYTLMNEEDKNKIADSTISFIDERLAVVSGQLGGLENDIEQFKVKNQISTDLPEQARLALNNASEIQGQITSQDVQINVVQSIEDHLKGNSPRAVPNAAVIQDPTYITTVQEYNALVLERDRQLQTTKPDNPVIQNLNCQINTVKGVLLTSLENIKKQMQISRNELASKNAQFLSLIQSGPSKERAITDISRQQNVQEQLYLYLLQKREETSISKSGTLANSRLIEPAKSDSLPFSPNKTMLYLIALGVGILLPAGSIYLKMVLNNRITNSADISKETLVPVLGEVGHNNSNQPIVAEQNSRTALAEQFRAIRTNLQFLLKGKTQQIVMITSSTSNEGKSFISLNLGSALAMSNKKVVIVELDLRKPKISKALGLSIEKGFTDYLISQYNREEVIKSTSVPNLFLISAGTIPPNPAELLLNNEVAELFTWLKTKFDYVIIDTPPVGIVIDAVTIGKHADACIYVVRQGFTFKDQLKIVNNLKQQEQLPNIAILLNDVKLNRTYGYNYGYYYGYGYTNGHASDYYSDGKKKKRSLLKNKR